MCGSPFPTAHNIDAQAGQRKGSQQAKAIFGRAEHLAQKARIARQFVYRKLEPGTAAHVWQVIHPHDTVIAAEDAEKFENINPDRIRYELTPDGKVAHLLKRW